jgi:beta-xylosidase
MTAQLPVETDAAVDTAAAVPWRDPRLSPAERAAALIPLMTLEEKAAQLVGVWVGADAAGGGVAPHQAEMKNGAPWSTVIRHGLGQLTRPFGTAPVDPVLGARSLAASQAQIAAASRFGIPAQVHEECLTGFAAWGATAYPAPLGWGASFDPELVEEMAGRIGRSMRAAGVHQGLAPVLDVTRDYRWGRTEETIGEDMSGVWRALGSSPRSSTSPGTPRPGAGAISRRCRWGHGSWPTWCCLRSRWRCAWAARAR